MDACAGARGLSAHARGAAAQALPVLDAGCGTGGFLRRAGLALPGTAMVGLEYNAHAAQRAAQKARAGRHRQRERHAVS